VFQGLTGERSVHLTDWPGPTDLPADTELVQTMDLVRDVCSAGHAIRKARGRRARLPLRSLTVTTADPERLRPFVALIADEVNVKEVSLSADLEDVAERVLTLVPSALGPRLGPEAPKVFAAMKKRDWTVSDTAVTAGGITLEPGEYELVLRPRHADEGRTLPGDVGVVTLDLTVDAALEAEGAARDVVRLVQAERRDAGFHISDCISLEVDAPAATVAAVEAHRSYVAEQTLATDIRLSVAEAVAIRMAKSPCPDGA
jgi:isoleucyl-tRNA synthetase